MPTEFIAALPPGYDERTRLALTEHNQVVAAHPAQPPLLLNSDGQWLALPPELVQTALASSTC